MMIWEPQLKKYIVKDYLAIDLEYKMSSRNLGR